MGHRCSAAQDALQSLHDYQHNRDMHWQHEPGSAACPLPLAHGVGPMAKSENLAQVGLTERKPIVWLRDMTYPGKPAVMCGKDDALGRIKFQAAFESRGRPKAKG